MSSAAGSPSRLHIGTSGWNYPHWRGVFYPDDLAVGRWFSHYAERFGTVEINSTFYRLPPESVFRKWAEQAPPGFIYAVKANRFITHRKKLILDGSNLGLFLSRARALGDALGPLLFQLPPRWRADPDRLREFCRALPPDLVSAFEFRDPSWHDDRILDLLRSEGAHYCIHDMPGSRAPVRVLSGSAYIRFHGATGRYQGLYEREELKKWAVLIGGYLAAGMDVYAYFNNDQWGCAVRNALELAELCR